MMSCNTTQQTTSDKNKLPENAVRIANDTLEYEIIIIDIGFDTYLASIAKPISFHSLSFLESKNRYYVTIWNQRARDLSRYNPNIYENIIEYDSSENYGLEVNYKLYNYFKFVEYKYHQKFY